MEKNTVKEVVSEKVQNLKGFVRKHSKKIIVGAVVVAGSVAALAINKRNQDAREQELKDGAIDTDYDVVETSSIESE